MLEIILFITHSSTAWSMSFFDLQYIYTGVYCIYIYLVYIHMTTITTRTYITPDMLSKPLSEFVSAGYGELFFVAEEEPVLTTE